MSAVLVDGISREVVSRGQYRGAESFVGAKLVIESKSD
jgi:hypothetical protein